jgi:hypothetical protein
MMNELLSLIQETVCDVLCHKLNCGDKYLRLCFQYRLHIFQQGYISKRAPGPASHSNASSRFDIYATQPAVESLDLEPGHNLKYCSERQFRVNSFPRTRTRI